MSGWTAERGNRFLMGGAALAVVWLALVSRIHVNASWSDDAWGYFVVPVDTPGRGKPLARSNPLARGDVVVFDPPDSLGAAVPYLKTVRGVPGDVIAVDTDRGVWIGGEYVGHAKPFSLTGRALRAIAPGMVPEDHYFMHADHVDSHDSRYAEIGLVPRDRIRGHAIALPDIPWLGLDGPPLARSNALARSNPLARGDSSRESESPIPERRP